MKKGIEELAKQKVHSDLSLITVVVVVAAVGGQAGNGTSDSVKVH